MKVIDKHLVESIDWSNDQNLSLLCQEEDYSIIVNPELDKSILKLITIDIPPSDSCIKYKIGEGWIAKRFPKNWNGHTTIIQLPITPVSITAGKYAVINSKVTDYKVPAWDLVYKHIWTYDTVLTNGQEVDAITISYIESASGRKVVGIADTEYINNIFDVIFIVYNEDSANVNWGRLKQVYPRAKRVIGVKGIYNAHLVAANVAETDMFYVVDADAYIKDFCFDYIPPIQDRDTVHIWHSHNPVNGLEYGYGGVKLFAKSHFQDIKDNVIDVSTSVGPVKIMPKVACETKFNTDPFSTWRSAFRECVKLSSKIIVNQDSKETEDRLRTWTTVGDKDSIAGACAGVKFGSANKGDINKLKKINDYNWLRNKFIEEQNEY
jgi:hypothetical protein